MSYFKINSSVILRTHLYTFNLKYNIYIFICKLNYFLKLGWLLLKPISKLLSLYLPHITCKSVSRGLNEGVPNIIWGRYRTQFSVKQCYASSWTVSIEHHDQEYPDSTLSTLRKHYRQYMYYFKSIIYNNFYSGSTVLNFSMVRYGEYWHVPTKCPGRYSCRLQLCVLLADEYRMGPVHFICVYILEIVCVHT